MLIMRIKALESRIKESSEFSWQFININSVNSK